MAHPLPRFAVEADSGATSASVSRLFRAVPMQAAAAAESEADRLEAARKQGFGEGLAQARAELAAEREQERLAHGHALAQVREELSEAVADRLVGELNDALERMRRALAEQIAAVLRPQLLDRLEQMSVEAIADVLPVLAAEERLAVVEVSGPERLLASLKDRLEDGAAEGLSAAAFEIRYSASDQPEIRVCANAAVIETQLRRWRAMVEESKS